ncbi:hypothetical protein VPBG_00199 [Vibrio phage helene 12B3]|uniref:hypothetical protein n=1 Tax=Vibrio phage helene 12B3 TaxID=573173 RepID=UPI0002C0DF40|nr:hypothetical protein VPBG_00199 [Vibrio phage helene 12B3]YP_009223068.1 hypothetical protein VPLG_00219 [Vibrio phage eugene 12A10]AGG57971.1 hypothetical protein VPBG_00199 [Vibrio phage helene 12B3]AGN51658.1 hypothetical protein VPLG_00219 [Vibrio phage eugene 12A10]
MKIKTNYVPEDCDYLTVGKVYEAEKDFDTLYVFTTDNGIECLVEISDMGCSHLDGCCWEIVEE